MKKIVLWISIITLAISLTLGCVRRQQTQPSKQETKTPAPQPAALKDGIYTAQESTFDKNGWKAITTVIVKGSKISNAFYDEINKDDNIKSLDQEYANKMKEKSGQTPINAVAKLSQSLIDKQDPAKVDAVSGATGTSTKFKTLTADALKGSPETKGAGGYYDGIFKAEESGFDEHGYKGMATVIIKDGKIDSAFFDEINKDGVLKSKDADYAKNMKAKSGTTPTEAVKKLVTSLINNQDAGKVDTVSGATGTSTKFKDLMGKALSLAK